MCGEAFGDLASERVGGGGRRDGVSRVVSDRGWGIAGRFGNGRVVRVGVKQSGAHFVQTHFREIDS
jgi:hypothetical protein